MRFRLLKEYLVRVIPSVQTLSCFCEVRILQFQHQQIKFDSLAPAFIEFRFINGPGTSPGHESSLLQL